MSLIEYKIVNENGVLIVRKIDKVKIAIARIKEFEPPEGYYLAFSGGKDSQTLYHLTIEAGVKFDAHFNLTTVDPPEVVQFVKDNYPDVELNKPPKSMFQIISENTIPPTRIARYCCKYLKEYSGDNRILLTGIRWQESTKRSKRTLFETCFKNKSKHYVNPIIDWSNGDVWEFIKTRNLKYCGLYDEGYKRIGCIMCPMAGEKGMIRDIIRFPKFYLLYHKALQNMLKNKIAKSDKKIDWKNSSDVMNWWIYCLENNDIRDPDQTVIFE